MSLIDEMGFGKGGQMWTTFGDRSDSHRCELPRPFEWEVGTWAVCRECGDVYRLVQIGGYPERWRRRSGMRAAWYRWRSRRRV